MIGIGPRGLVCELFVNCWSMVYGMAFILSVHMGEVFGAWDMYWHLGLSEFWISVVLEIWLLFFFLLALQSYFD